MNIKMSFFKINDKEVRLALQAVKEEEEERVKQKTEIYVAVKESERSIGQMERKHRGHGGSILACGRLSSPGEFWQTTQAAVGLTLFSPLVSPTLQLLDLPEQFLPLLLAKLRFTSDFI